MKDFLGRTPFALLGAIGLLSLIRDLAEWQTDIQMLLDAYQLVSASIWGFAIGWIPGFTVPQLLADYLTMGLVVVGAGLRGTIAANIGNGRSATHDIAFITIPFVVLIWPFTLVLFLYMIVRPDMYETEGNAAFLETFVWALLIIAVNYALLWGA